MEPQLTKDVQPTQFFNRNNSPVCYSFIQTPSGIVPICGHNRNLTKETSVNERNLFYAVLPFEKEKNQFERFAFVPYFLESLKREFV